ncbi:hypothetical protein IC232_26650 [Microvirga sp. BT688]|uniref:hypothetical protein n=1 Tax=Microvirga sp. TaxID=1873136 RepID=UPI0016844E1B|nr:hypothetical protein [Microvirga sp.]MBD2750246.1 hypothetical protein [Microvirga sp.]
MLNVLVLSALLLIGCVHGAQADEETSDLRLCPSWSVNVETNLVLWQAVEAAYPAATVDYSRDAPDRPPCISPYTVLTYGTFMVLITLAGEPGEACHGCGAQVGAVFLQRDGGALTVTGRHDGFTEAGTFGDLMAVASFRLGSQDGLIVEAGGTFQGYSSSALIPFLIRGGRMKPVGPENGISSGDSDCGVRDGPCRDVSGSWHADGKRLIVRYLGKRANGTPVNGSVAYEMKRSSLILVSGRRLATEMEKSRP